MRAAGETVLFVRHINAALFGMSFMSLLDDFARPLPTGTCCQKVMEFVPGGDLASLLRALGTFTDDMASFYIAETTAALRYLHQHEIIHG